VIYHRDVTNPRSDQRLGGPGTDTAHPDDADPELAEEAGGTPAIDSRHGGEGVGHLKVQWHVYILRCADDTLYTGITTDVERRLAEHNASARGATYTRGRRPVRLVWQASAANRSDASRQEHRLKRLTRAAKEHLVDVAVAGQAEPQGVHSSPYPDCEQPFVESVCRQRQTALDTCSGASRPGVTDAWLSQFDPFAIAR